MSARPLTPGEAALARSVFGEAIVYERVRIAGGGFGRFTVTTGPRINVAAGARSPDYAREGPPLQALFIHEMVHVWQFQTRPLRTLRSWAGVVARGGYGPGLPGYRYDLPLRAWRTLNLEQQASAVEHAFLLSSGCRTAAMPWGAELHHYADALPFDPHDRRSRVRER